MRPPLSNKMNWVIRGVCNNCNTAQTIFMIDYYKYWVCCKCAQKNTFKYTTASQIYPPVIFKGPA